MTIYEWLCVLGVPAIVFAALKLMFNHIKAVRQEMESVKLGLQAMLRAQMIAEYNKWEERGHAPIYARENFENCWVNYHALGANGVMDDIHKKFLRLPTEKPEE